MLLSDKTSLERLEQKPHKLPKAILEIGDVSSMGKEYVKDSVVSRNLLFFSIICGKCG